jgi:hypothetical protein
MKIPFQNTIERHCDSCQEQQLRCEQYLKGKGAEKQRQEEAEKEEDKEIEGKRGN